MTEAEQAAALNEAWANTVTPWDQIQTEFGLEGGQYDFIVKALTPGIHPKGYYVINGEFDVAAPVGFPTYKRALFVGTKKDFLARDPQTRLNSPGLRFLLKIAKANNLSTNPQPDAALCASLIGKGFGNHIEETKYTKDDGTEAKGSDFGRNVTPIGVVPATGPDRLRAMNGTEQVAAAQPAGPAATFAVE